jgi:hypothetical protein
MGGHILLGLGFELIKVEHSNPDASVLSFICNSTFLLFYEREGQIASMVDEIANVF